MGKMLKKAKEMKSEMKKVQNELKDLIIEGKKNGVCVKVSGELECVEVSFENDTLPTTNLKELEKSIKHAFNQACKEAKNIASKRLSTISQGLNIPGLT